MEIEKIKIEALKIAVSNNPPRPDGVGESPKSIIEDAKKFFDYIYSPTLKD